MKPGDEKGQEHKRFLLVDLISYGADIYKLTVALNRKGEKPRSFNAADEVPSPLKLGHPVRFYHYNDNPRKSLGFEELEVDDVSIVINSGHIPIKTLKGKKIKKTLDAWSRVDNNLPERPKPIIRQSHGNVRYDDPSMG